MANRFSDVGLRAYTGDDLENMFREQIGAATWFDADGKIYARIGMGGGLVYWLCFTEGNGRPVLIDEDFHFHSAHRNDVCFCNVLAADGEKMNGMIRVHLPVGDTDIPLNLGVPMLAATERLSCGDHCRAQIAGYAEAVMCWPDLETFDRSFPNSRHPAAEHIVPTGTFAPKNASDAAQSPRAMIGGYILASERCTNAISGQEYRHITVRSLGTVFDLLVDMEELEEEPVIGGILHGSFRLSAMMYPGPDEEYSTADSFAEEKGETPEAERDSAGCRMVVTRPISDRIAQRIHDILASLTGHSSEFIVIEFQGRDDGSEFVQSCVDRTENGTPVYRVEYACVEDGRKTIRARRHLGLEEASALITEACRVPPEAFDFSRWLDIGWEDPDIAGENDGGNGDDDDDDLPAPDGGLAEAPGHCFPEVTYEKTTKRYLDVTSGSGFLEDIRIHDREDTAAFRMIIRNEEKTPLSPAEVESLESIAFYAVSVLYTRNLNVDGMQVEILNDPDGELLWARDKEHRDRYHIALCADTCRDWSQTIYQFGYAFAHCVIDYCCVSGKVPWMEETICEMMSVWLLSSFANHWKQFRLYDTDPGYQTHLREYIQAFMTEQDWTNLPARCASMKELLSMNDHAGEHDEDRVGTVIQLYYLTVSTDIEALFNYGRYAHDIPGLVNTDEWRGAYPGSLAVRYLASLQDNAVGDDPGARSQG